MYRKFNEKSDVWSYGVTVWEIFSYGEAPKLGELDKLVHLLHSGTRLQKPAVCSKNVFDIIYFGCWQWENSERKTFVEIRDQLKAQQHI